MGYRVFYAEIGAYEGIVCGGDKRRVISVCWRIRVGTLGGFSACNVNPDNVWKWGDIRKDLLMNCLNSHGGKCVGIGRTGIGRIFEMKFSLFFSLTLNFN